VFISRWKSTQTPLFPSVMSYKQYKLQCKFPHFIDNAELNVSYHLAKDRRRTDHFNNKFQTLYTLKQDTAIDKSLLKLHGRLSFIHFNPTKQAHFGIKYYKIYETSSDYCTLCSTKIKQPGSDEKYSCIIIWVILLSLYLCICGFFRSSIHYNQSRCVYINQRHQHICLFWSWNIN
jgi:hypothetical protein